MSIAYDSTAADNISSKILPAAFKDKAISANLTCSYFRNFKGRIGFTGLITKYLCTQLNVKAPNSTYTVPGILDFMTDAVFLGHSRFSHMDELRNDRAYLELAGSAPSEKVCRDLLKALPESTSGDLRKLNKELLRIQSAMNETREVCIDFDDTVVTVFGHQEKSAVGYNPRYNGRASFKEKIGMVSGSRELLDLTLEEGNHHSNHAFLDFFKDCEQTLPETMIIKRLRADCGFFDSKTFGYWEEKQYEYVVKAKKLTTIQKIIAYVTEHPSDYKWHQAEEGSIFSVTEITVPLPGWDKARRFVIIRKTLDAKDKNGQIIMDEFRYEYQVIVTNIDYMSAAEIFHEYNQRCTIETSIDELKDGFAFCENSQLNHKCNELFLLIKMIAYNLHNWFRLMILPENMRSHRIGTLRRILYRVSGILTGNGWYRRIIYQSDPKLERAIEYIRNALIRFRPYPQQSS